MQIIHGKTGWIEVICGPMFSGKSEELIRRIRRAQIAKQRIQLFKPQLDDRYSKDEIVTHDQQRLPSMPVPTSNAILDALQDKTAVVGIDEAQFFDEAITVVCNKLANLGKRVIVAGLDMDYRGQPFDPIPRLMAIAEDVTKQLAICVLCGNPANHTQRLIGDQHRIVVGSQGTYEARCRQCFEPPESELADEASEASGD